MKLRLDEATVLVAEKILNQGKRVELIPVKDGVKVIWVERHEAKKYEISRP